MSGRSCEECGAVLVRRSNEKPGRFKRRRWCSRKCTAHARRLVTPEEFAARQERRRAAWRRYHYRHKEARNAEACARAKENRDAIREVRRLKRAAFRAELAGLSPQRRAEVLAMAEFARRRGITQCPVKFAASTQGALSAAAASRRIAALNIDHESDSWKAQRDSARAQIARQ